MLKSDVMTLKRDAAKKIYRGNFNDERVFDVVEAELLKGYEKKYHNKHEIDTMSWLCKVLGASGMQKYRATLEKIVDAPTNVTLYKFA